jgi:signal transduction histidine kinase/DNA-binding LacI/PurR family transcriptional regulator
MSDRASSPQGDALTIGILVSSADDKFENALLRGVSDVALKAGANWTCFTSGAIRSHHGFEFQRNVLYDLVNAKLVNGLVISGTLGHGVSNAELREFCLNYHPLPVVTVAVELDGIPCVTSDSYRGISDTVNHLLLTHHRERIAFIRGPVGHQEADDRFRAFMDVLTSHGVSAEDALKRVVIGDYTMASGQRAMKDFLARGESFNAVVGANDSMALGALQVLSANGYRIPEDVSLTGFDNTDDSRHSNPPLTTAQQLVYEMGRQAGQMLITRLQGREISEKIVIPPSLILRESCGCSNHALKNAAFTYHSTLTADVISQDAVIESMCQAVPEYLQDRYKPWIEAALDSFQKDMQNSEGGKFIKTLENLVPMGLSIPGSDNYWHDVFFAMRRVVLKNAQAGFDIPRAEMLWGQAPVLVGEAVRKNEVGLRLHAENRSMKLREISEMLMSSRRLADVLDVIVLELPGLGIRSCYLSLFEDVKYSLEWSRLILAYNPNEQIHLKTGGVRFPSHQLLPDEMIVGNGPVGLVAEALYSKEERLGFMLLEVDAEEAAVCGALRGLLSSALQGVILQEQREQAEEQLRQYQKNLEQLVEDRTIELTRTNEKLGLLIQELEAKNAELERFAYTVSHDLKAPLVTIKGFLGYLREDALSGNSRRLESDIRRIADAADKMHALLSDLLELSRIGRMMNKPEDIPFNDLVIEALALTDGRLREGGVKVNVEEGLPTVFGDRQRLVEVIQNLVDNAAKFMGPQPTPLIEIGTSGMKDGMPVIHIRDNGVGIAPEFHERIFGLFNRLDPTVEGTGIGLTLVRRIIEFHGGRIWVESEAGKGAKFLFTLPQAQG